MGNGNLMPVSSEKRNYRTDRLISVEDKFAEAPDLETSTKNLTDEHRQKSLPILKPMNFLLGCLVTQEGTEVGLAFVHLFLAINMTCPKSSTYSLVACFCLYFLNCSSQVNSISGNLSLLQFTS